jgi:hypothetical protein
MSDNLPFFRFYPLHWQNGDVVLEDYETQGLFINVCSFYWIKECSITLTMLKKKYSNAVAMLQKLIESEIIKLDTETDEIHITFLDEQFDILAEKRKNRQDAGRLGGIAKRSNATAMLQQCSSKSVASNSNSNSNNIKKGVFGVVLPEPDQPIPDDLNTSRVEVEETGSVADAKKQNSSPPPVPPPPPSSFSSEDFRAIMRGYPGSKDNSYEVLFTKFKAYCKKFGLSVSEEAKGLRDGIARYREWYAYEMEKKAADKYHFVPSHKNASVFINNGSWNGEYETEATAKKKQLMEC